MAKYRKDKNRILDKDTTLVIPHGGNVVNNDSLNVGINSVRRSASWIYDSIDQVWYQFDAT